MPGEDSRFPTVNGRILHPDRCWFDFSSGGSDGGVDDQYSKLATIQPEFADLAERPDVCPPVKAFSGPMAYFLVGEMYKCRTFIPLHVMVQASHQKSEGGGGETEAKAAFSTKIVLDIR